MPRRLPLTAIILGLAGLLPFFGFALAAVSTSSDRSPAILLALIGYGSVVLGFLGGVHWGLVLGGRRVPGASLVLGDGTPTTTNGDFAPGDGVGPAPPTRDASRLAFGVLPPLAGWFALLVGLVARPSLALALLIVAYLATLVAETRAGRAGLLPAGYMALRWGLSVAVIATLTTVLVIRLLGARIIF